MANLGYIQLVRSCNQQCRFCSNPETPNVLELDAACRLVDDLAARSYQGVVLTGGEPSLSPIALDVVRYCRSVGLSVRMISNGSRLAEPPIAASFVEAGLLHYHLSLYSNRLAVHDYLTCVPGSLDRVVRAMDNLVSLQATVDVNMVINRLNCDHLHEVAAFVIERFPGVAHVVINNLDPSMGRARANPEVVHRLADMELSLHRALALLHRAGRSFRVERVPLCYMAEFAHTSTETRKIVKGEERIVNFLDEKGMFRQTSFVHGKAPVCAVCRLNELCAGLFHMGDGYDPRELSPLFLDPEPIRERITRESETGH